jgi:predicted transcriptional regulator of viral defense system
MSDPVVAKCPDETILGIAATQHGMVTRRQLLDAGVPPDVIDRRRKVGLMRTVHRGVYAVGPVSAPHGREMAAALACGASAVVSHRSAAFLHALIAATERPAVAEAIDRNADHRVPGVRVYRIRSVAAHEVTRRDGIPITTVARTLYDLATVSGARQVERALATRVLAHFRSRLSGLLSS